MFKMKKPFGYSIHIGLNSKFLPTVILAPLKVGTIRPKTNEDIGFYEEAEVSNVVFFGVRFDLLFGTLRRPIPKFFKKEFWLGNAKDPGDLNYVRKESAINPWNSGNHWFVLSIPIMPAFFFSICCAIGKNKDGTWKQPGGYIGFKTYQVDQISSQLLDYETQEYLYNESGDPIYTWPTEEEQGNMYLCLSATTRSDLVEDI